MEKAEKTRLLYLEDAYIREFEAKIIKIERIEDKFGIVLDQTAFYPLGGGQPSDTGEIFSETGRAIITFVEKRGNQVFHFADKIEGKLAEGHTIKGVIDWSRRYRLMRTHTAAHLLSEAVRRTIGKPLEIVGSAIELEKARFDFKYEKSIRELFPEIEKTANNVVAEDRPVIIKMMPREEAEKYLAKYNETLKTLPAHVQTVRIVEIENWHACACGGTHVRSTGEIGGIKLLRRKSKGKGIERIEFTVV